MDKCEFLTGESSCREYVQNYGPTVFAESFLDKINSDVTIDEIWSYCSTFNKLGTSLKKSCTGTSLKILSRFDSWQEVEKFMFGLVKDRLDKITCLQLEMSILTYENGCHFNDNGNNNGNDNGCYTLEYIPIDQDKILPRFPNLKEFVFSTDSFSRSKTGPYPCQFDIDKHAMSFLRNYSSRKKLNITSECRYIIDYILPSKLELYQLLQSILPSVIVELIINIM
jgi:hypothetical protein